MVLWTKNSFKGVVKIEYDYPRLDHENRCITILSIQATGTGQAPYVKEIDQWNELCKVPAMITCHVDDAAVPEGYIRGRRYVPEKNGLKGTELEPDCFLEGLCATA
jgi:hypothetical protein